VELAMHQEALVFLLWQDSVEQDLVQDSAEQDVVLEWHSGG